MQRCNKKEKERLLGIEPNYLLSQAPDYPVIKPGYKEYPDYLRFWSDTDNTLTISYGKSSCEYNRKIKADINYSFDRENWIKIPEVHSYSIDLKPKQMVFFRGINQELGYYVEGICNTAINMHFQGSNPIYCGGNIMTLVDGKGETTIIPSPYFFFELFESGNLLTAPKLPATTLTGWCYRNMFRYNNLLENAPELHALTLVDRCYMDMYNGCTSLNKIIIYAQDISANICLKDWLNNVSATGDFYNLGGATYPSGASGIPEGWAEHTTLE